MRIQMTSTAVGPDRHHVAGQTYDVDDVIAEQYLAGGYAVVAPAPAKGPVQETAEVPGAPETTDARPRGRGLKAR